MLNKLRSLDIPQKQSWLGMFFIGLSILFWSLATYALALGTTNVGVLSFLIFLGILWAVVYGLLVLFADKRITYFLYGFLGVLLLVLYGFYDFNFIGVLLFVLILFLAHLRASRFRGFIADFRPYHISRRFLPLFFTGLAILFAFIYNSYVLKYYINDPHIPREIYSVAFVPVEYSLGFMFAGYERDMTVAEFQDVLLKSFVSRFLPADYAGEFDPANMPELFGQNISEVTLEDFTYAWVNDAIDTILEPYSEFLPAFFILGLFFVFRLIFLPFVWLSTGFLLLAIRVLSLYNIIVIKEVTTVKEIPVLE